MISPYIIPGLRRNTKVKFIKAAAKIREAVTNYYGEENDFINNSSRKKEIIKARQIYMYLLKRNTDYSLKRIGETMFSHKYDHTTVMHAVTTVSNQLSLYYDNEFKIDVKNIMETL